MLSIPLHSLPFAPYGLRVVAALQNTEFVALRVGQNHPRDIALPNVNTRSSEPNQSLDFGYLIVRTKIDMETILRLLCILDGQEQDARKLIRLRLDLKDGRDVVDDNPIERLAPPPTQRGRVMRGDHDLFPLEAHGQTLAEAPSVLRGRGVVSRTAGTAQSCSDRGIGSVVR